MYHDAWAWTLLSLHQSIMTYHEVPLKSTMVHNIILHVLSRAAFDFP